MSNDLLIWVQCHQNWLARSMELVNVCQSVAVGVNQVEETLSPLGVAGRGTWLAPRREPVKDHAPPPGPAPLSRLGDWLR